VVKRKGGSETDITRENGSGRKEGTETKEIDKWTERERG
jgi:hypothetical protein